MTPRVVLVVIAVLVSRLVAAEPFPDERSLSAIAEDVLTRVGESGTAVLCRIEVEGEIAHYTIIEHWSNRRPQFLAGYLWVMAEGHKRSVRHGEPPSFTAVLFAREGAFSLVPVSEGQVQHLDVAGSFSRSIPLHVYRRLVIETLSDDRPSSNQLMQRTAGRSAFYLSMTSTCNLQRNALSPAVADLGSR